MGAVLFMRVTIVIPTYNESENLKKLIPLLNTEFTKVPQHSFTILVVDGNSPDGTSETVLELAKTYPFLRLLKETEKAGLGAAYIFAFKHVLKEIPSDAVLEMDGDLQHNPAEVLSLVGKIEEGYDYVIGSRFVKGGSIPAEWGLHRKLLSVGGNLFTQILLGTKNIHDYTSGFRATRSTLLAKMDLDAILSKGFAYKMDLLYQANKLGAKIVEVPIHFGVREDGESKMERNNMLDSLRVVITIKARNSKHFFKFLITGFAGLFTDTSLFNILRLFMKSSASAALAGSVAMVVTYLINNFWSFNHNKKESKLLLLRDFPVYAAFSYVPILVRTYLVSVAEARFGQTFIVDNIAFFIGIAFGLVWNYTVYSRLIWRKSKKA
jgi:dolichol-phosphate mannosyltransferase